jgi:cytochrome c oxidase assembly protein subunit 15
VALKHIENETRLQLETVLPVHFFSRRLPLGRPSILVNRTSSMRPELSSPSSSPWLHWFAVLTAVATLVLLGAGGLVTSHGVGMAVPDWPNTYGYNMFFFPVSRWVGGIFYEHSHRLLASGVGLMTAVLALWLYGKSSQPFLRWTGLVLLGAAAATWLAAPRHWRDGVVLAVVGAFAFGASWLWPGFEPSPKWLRRLGLAAFIAVVLQGVLGGLRVVLFKDQLGIFHATLAQLFFALTCALALFTSRWWQRGRNPESEIRISSLPLRRLRFLFAGATLLILCQLVLGATMRHQHAGLAIADFPLAYGKLWPAMDPQSVAHYNQHRVEVVDVNPITAFQVGLQMVHRLAALLILGMVGCCAWSARRHFGRATVSSRLAAVWLGVLLLQALLGAATIWTNKAADVATAHVLIGALALALGTVLSLVSCREVAAVAGFESVSDPSGIGPSPVRSGGEGSPLPAGWKPSATTHPAPATGLD